MESSQPRSTSDLQAAIYSVVWITGGISLILCLLRLFVRYKVLSAFGWDDFVIAICFVVQIPRMSLVTAAVAYGVGEHIYNIPSDDVIPALKYGNISSSVSTLYFPLPKIAILLLIQRTFDNSKSVMLFFWTNIVLLALLAIGDTIYGYLKCSPVEKNWDFEIPGTCEPAFKQVDIALAISVYCAFLDGVLALYPITQIRKLMMSFQRKLTVSAIMGAGIIATVFAVAKCPTLRYMGSVTDPTYQLAPLIILTDIEMNVLTSAACISALGPLFRIIRQKAKRQTYESRLRNEGLEMSYKSARNELRDIEGANLSDESLEAQIRQYSG